MNEMQIFALGCITPFLLIAVVGLGVEGFDRLKGWYRTRTIPIAAYARCREWGCDYDCASWIGHGQKRSARQMLREHMEAAHSEVSS